MPTIEDSSFLIVGLARNCVQTLERDIRSLFSAFNFAKKIIFLIIESDSSDGTPKLLRKLSIENQNFYFISLGNLRDRYPKRTDRIAHCRNYYMRLIKEGSQYRDVHYIVVADMNGVNSKLDTAAIKSCWNREDWDVCTANQLGPYYDIWALRHEFLSPNDCWEQARFMRSLGLSRFKAVLSAVYSRMVRVPPTSKWIEVESAFGGLAIYRQESIQFVNYVGLTDFGEEICEHVSAHKQIRLSGGRIFINPALINAGVVGHARNATSFGLIKFWFSCQAHDLAYFLRLVQFWQKVRSFKGGQSA
jgi:hypothetical protein